MKIDARCGGFAIPFSSASLPPKCWVDAAAAREEEEEEEEEEEVVE